MSRIYDPIRYTFNINAKPLVISSYRSVVRLHNRPRKLGVKVNPPIQRMRA